MTRTEITRDVQRVRRLAQLLDSAIRIPVIGVRLGLDSLLGLVPGVGDAVGAGLSAYPVLIALRHRLPLPVVLRLLGNIAIDALFGVVPVLGDVFDIGFKANLRNQRLIERYADAPLRTEKRSRVAIWVAGVGIIAIVGSVVALAIWLVSNGLRVLTS